MAKYVVGVDGGGTKTEVAVLAVADGKEVAVALGPCTNQNSIGKDKAAANLQSTLQSALAKAGVSDDNIASCCLCMAGVDRDQDRALITEWTRAVLPSADLLVYNDAVGALAAATGGDMFGIVAVSGTGMIAVGYNKSKTKRAGGWGPVFGDHGSGYDIGVQILRAVGRAEDGSGPETALTKHVLEHTKVESVRDLISWAYADGAWDRIAALAPLAKVCKAEGDAEATRILAEAAAELAGAVATVAKSLDIDQSEVPIVVCGGNLTKGNENGPNALLAAFSDEVHKFIPKSSIVIPETKSCVGAALLALHRARETGL